MRRLLVMSILVGAMVALEYLVPGTTGAGNPKTLAAIGFIIMAAFTLGDLVGRIGLPRITGYIITGVAFGPSLADIFSLGIVQDLRVFNDLAVGLIALSAGLELELPRVRAVLKPALRILAFKIPLVVVAGGGTVLLLAPFLPGFGEGMEIPILVLAMVFGVVLLGTSPAVTLAIISETGSKGRLADLSLALAVLKDVIMVIGLAVVLAIGKSLLAGGGFESEVFGHLAIELGLSLGVGTAVGVAIIAYMRWFGAEMMLFVVSLVIGMNEVAHQVHLEALLVFITAGFVVRNFSRFGDGVLHPLEKVALPVFVVFFTTAGAGLDLSALADYGPIALAIAVVRAGALFVAARWGAAWAGEAAAVRDNAWLAFIPQAGVAIGLLLVAANQLSDYPELAAPLNLLGVSLVAINLLVGPVTLKIALARAGELPDAAPEPAPAAEEEADAEPSLDASVILGAAAVEPESDAADDDAGDDPDPISAAIAPADVSLARAWSRTRSGLEELVSRIHSEVDESRFEAVRAALRTTAGHARQRLQAAADACGRLQDADAARRVLTDARANLAATLLADIEQLRAPADRSGDATTISIAWSEAEAIVGAAPTVIVVPQEPRHRLAQPGDKAVVRLGKFVRRVGRRLGPRRAEVPTRRVSWRRLVRRAIAGEFILALDPVGDLQGRSGFKALRRVERLLRSAQAAFDHAELHLDAGGTGPELQALLQQHVQDLRGASRLASDDIDRIAAAPSRHAAFEARRALDHLTQLSDTAGTFVLAERHYRYSRVAPAARAAVARAQATRLPWLERQQALLGRLALWLQGDLLNSRLRSAVTEIATRPSQRLHSRLFELLGQAVAQVHEARPSVEALASRDDSAEPGLDVAAEQLVSDLERRVERPLGGIVYALQSSGVVDRLLAAIAEVTHSLPDSVNLLSDTDILALEQGQLVAARPVAVEVREAARRYLDRQVAVRFTEQMRYLDAAADRATGAVTDVRHMLAYQLAQAADHATSDDGEPDARRARVTTVIAEAFDRAEHQLARQVEQIVGVGETLGQEVAAIESQALTGLWRQLHGDAATPLDPTDTLLQRLRERLVAVYNARFAPPIARGHAWVRSKLTATREAARAREAELVLSTRRVRERMARLRPDYEALPYVYGKLFTLGPVENPAFVVGHDEAQVAMRAAFESGGGGAIALVGARGSGRTSLLRGVVVTGATNRTILWLDADTPSKSPAELTRWLSDATHLTSRRQGVTLADELRDQRPIVVIDGLEHLFHRSAGGLAAIDELAGLIIASRDDVQWVVSAERSVWRLLDEVVRVSLAFRDVLELGPLDAAELRQAIESRHRLSGMDLEFVRRETGPVRRLLARIKRRSDVDTYFRELAEQSGGVPRTAMQLWLASLTLGDANRLVVRPCPSLRIEALSRLSSDLALALRIAFEEGPIDVHEFAASAGWSAHIVQSSLSFLEAAGLVVGRPRTDGVIAFEVDLAAQGPVRLELRRRALVPAQWRRL